MNSAHKTGLPLFFADDHHATRKQQTAFSRDAELAQSPHSALCVRCGRGEAQSFLRLLYSVIGYARLLLVLTSVKFYQVN